MRPAEDGALAKATIEVVQTETAQLNSRTGVVPLAISCRASAALRALFALATLWMLAGQGPAPGQRGSCKPHEIAVDYEDASELAAACRAVSDVVGYFAGIGFQVPTKVAVRYANRAGNESKAHSPAHGLFDPQRSQIVINRTSTATPWGQPWSLTLAASFLRHEIVHSAIWDILKGNPKQLRPEWHEFIAYAIQLDLMDPELRQLVLAAHPGAGAAADLSEINEFSYGMNPETFAVVAYRTYLQRGAAAFVRQLLKGEIKPPAMSYPFAVQPHEVWQ